MSVVKHVSVAFWIPACADWLLTQTIFLSAFHSQHSLENICVSGLAVTKPSGLVDFLKKIFKGFLKPNDLSSGHEC